jgi:uncharacterized protein YndB with AHSA1/START domain
MTDTLQAPAAKAQMLIRRPVAQVFEAMVDPAITSRFWFSKGSGRLEAGKQVRWDWEMYGASAEVDVKAVEENRRILIEWGGPENPTSVEWTFEPRGEDRTFVTVSNWGFHGDAEKTVAAALDSTGAWHRAEPRRGPRPGCARRRLDCTPRSRVTAGLDLTFLPGLPARRASSAAGPGRRDPRA